MPNRRTVSINDPIEKPNDLADRRSHIEPVSRSHAHPRVERIGFSCPAGLYFGSMPKLKTDEQLLMHLEERAPEVLAAKVNFDALVGKVLAAGSVDTGRTPKRRKHTAEARHKPSDK